MKLITVQLNQVDGEDFAAWATYGAAHPHEAVDRLIRALAKARSTLEAAVSEKMPVFTNDQPAVDGPTWRWELEANGSLVLNLRHPGLGWLRFRMRDMDLFQDNLANMTKQRDALLSELKPSVD